MGKGNDGDVLAAIEKEFDDTEDIDEMMVEWDSNEGEEVTPFADASVVAEEVKGMEKPTRPLGSDRPCDQRNGFCMVSPEGNSIIGEMVRGEWDNFRSHKVFVSDDGIGPCRDCPYALSGGEKPVGFDGGHSHGRGWFAQTFIAGPGRHLNVIIARAPDLYEFMEENVWSGVDLTLDYSGQPRKENAWDKGRVSKMSTLDVRLEGDNSSQPIPRVLGTDVRPNE